eukprot:1183144-Prorocentrum_minimum.AAC.5
MPPALAMIPNVAPHLSLNGCLLTFTWPFLVSSSGPHVKREGAGAGRLRAAVPQFPGTPF